MVCAPVGRGGCYQQIYTALSGTGGGALGKGHAGSWASCAEMVRGSWAYWWLGSCSGKRLLKHKETNKQKKKRKSINISNKKRFGHSQNVSKVVTQV